MKRKKKNFVSAHNKEVISPSGPHYQGEGLAIGQVRCCN